MDFHSLTGGVSRSISFQSSMESLKEKKSQKFISFPALAPVTAFVTENVGAHGLLHKSLGKVVGLTKAP